MDLITKIASLGAMGVTVFVIMKVNELLQKEQEKDKPRKVILKEINNFKIFAIAMTLIALGIEVTKYFMERGNSKVQKDYDSLVEDLNKIQEEQNFYSVDLTGTPSKIKVRYNKEEHILSQAYPENKFEENSIYLEKSIDSVEAKNYVYNKHGSKNIRYGQITDKDLKSFANHLFETENNNNLKPEDFLALGIGYSPKKTREVLKSSIESDAIARKYLIEVLNLPDIPDNYTKQKEALKLLVQPLLMKYLDPPEYEKVIRVLEANKIRKNPYRLWDLAQVYSSRNSEGDDSKRKKYYKDFLIYMNKQSQTLINTDYTEKRMDWPEKDEINETLRTLKNWYIDSRKRLSLDVEGLED